MNKTTHIVPDGSSQIVISAREPERTFWDRHNFAILGAINTSIELAVLLLAWYVLWWPATWPRLW